MVTAFVWRVTGTGGRVVGLTYGLPPRTAQAIIVTVLLFLHLVDIVSRGCSNVYRSSLISSRTGLDALRECLKKSWTGLAYALVLGT